MIARLIIALLLALAPAVARAQDGGVAPDGGVACVKQGKFPGVGTNTTVPADAIVVFRAGQSNDTGMELLRPKDTGVVEGIFLRAYKQEYGEPVTFFWEAFAEPAHRYSTWRNDPLKKAGFGSTQEMAKTLHTLCGRPIYVVADGQPSTPIASYYKDGVMWKDRLKRYAGIRVDLVVDTHGESGVGDTNYLANRLRVIDEYRAMWQAPCVPWVLTEILHGEAGCTTGQVANYGSGVNAQIAQAAAARPAIGVSSSAGLKGYPACTIHFSHDSYIEKGRREGIAGARLLGCIP